LLMVRRAVEAEAASLAALRATKREIRQIEHAVQRHTEEVRRRGVSIESNRAIHGLIAKASRSRVLEALINILLQEEYLHEIQTRIQRAADGLVPEDHLIVFQAIKSRQPDKAAKAMRAHMDRLLRVVQSYSAKRKSARRRRRGTRTHA
jgi:GntR family transcriptional repressor for pyruvate dehydrogenase complex